MMVEESLLTIGLFCWLFLKVAREAEERQALLDYAGAHGIELDERRAARAVAAGRGEELGSGCASAAHARCRREPAAPRRRSPGAGYLTVERALHAGGLMAVDRAVERVACPGLSARPVHRRDVPPVGERPRRPALTPSRP